MRIKKINLIIPTHVKVLTLCLVSTTLYAILPSHAYAAGDAALQVAKINCRSVAQGIKSAIGGTGKYYSVSVQCEGKKYIGLFGVTTHYPKQLQKYTYYSFGPGESFSTSSGETKDYWCILKTQLVSTTMSNGFTLPHYKSTWMKWNLRTNDLKCCKSKQCTE